MDACICLLVGQENPELRAKMPYNIDAMEMS